MVNRATLQAEREALARELKRARESMLRLQGALAIIEKLIKLDGGDDAKPEDV